MTQEFINVSEFGYIIYIYNENMSCLATKDVREQRIIIYIYKNNYLNIWQIYIYIC